jgi:hypothetical protein
MALPWVRVGNGSWPFIVLLPLLFCGEACHAQTNHFTRILSFTSSLVLSSATEGWGTYRPEVEVNTAGRSHYLLLTYKQYANGIQVTTNRPVGAAQSVWTNWEAKPSGAVFVFKMNPTNGTVVGASPVFTMQIPTAHSYSVGSAWKITNAFGFYYALPTIVTNVRTNYDLNPPRRETNIWTDLYGRKVEGIMQTTNNGTTWQTNLNYGTGIANFVALNGAAHEDLTNTYLAAVRWINTNNAQRVAFDVYRVP